VHFHRLLHLQYSMTDSNFSIMQQLYSISIFWKISGQFPVLYCCRHFYYSKQILQYTMHACTALPVQHACTFRCHDV
jgi:hypothetical protein